MKRRILVAGADSAIFQSIRNCMQSETVDVCYIVSTLDALESILKCEYCLVIISVQSTEAKDMEILRIIRNTQKLPIIALTDKLSTDDKVMLFQTGANAYIEKPIDLAVCIAQTNSLLRLYLEAQEENREYCPLVFGTELIIDPTYRQIIVDGEPLELTCKEFDLLLCLAQHPYQIWSRTQLYRYVWNNDLGLSGDNTVKTHIGNLKKKLSDLKKDYIQNSRGVGYKFVPPSCDIE